MNEIGDKLKEARKAKGYTLDDLQQKTKIQKRYLIAVEEGNLDVLPGNFYARAFIKQYADSVGLNGDDLIREHMDALPQTNNSNYSKSVHKTQTRSKTKNSGFVATLRDSLPTLLIVLLVVAIVFAIYLAITTGSDSDLDSFINEDEPSTVIEVDDNEEAASDPEEESETEEVNDEQTDTDTEETADEEESVEDQSQTLTEVSSTETSTTYTVSGPHPSEQTIILNAEGGDSWSSITIDGETASGLIADGESLSGSFDENVAEVSIVIGNAAVTTIELNGQEVPYNTSEAEAVRQEVTIEFE
ncbi:protein RodZ, contains Xre-like HTH and DUF4115 domains [Alkalibacterium putridalgicola]|uniref:Protein RodZ, contains Xre-like HTH and DUF4115 domains n=1 Tax=Alkalibacterium putridalgicola TaxID=426703 RepID=A0A1H7T2L4_9LACT|nr:helix-turn-helix domain-containing protein [Alkalibacterium putridalgicola]GEK89277.1 XRE family transcriptional regulator [Alkalibacterium putridalgicola]SEL78484.1 protein RodZ, contains Xre-like HTH and DUF4115 domains [Alkalibacterium putridalgicola]